MRKGRGAGRRRGKGEGEEGEGRGPGEGGPESLPPDRPVIQLHSDTYWNWDLVLYDLFA